MIVDLLDRSDLNAYLEDIVYMGQEMDRFTVGNFKSLDYVRSNKDAIVRSMVFQWTKDRLATHLLQDKNAEYLVPVSYSEDLKDWAKTKLSQGKELFTFNISKIPPALQGEIALVRDYLYDEAKNYVDKETVKSENTGKPIKLRMTRLKEDEHWETFTDALAQADKWHYIMAQKASTANRNIEMYTKSLAGTQSVMKLADDMEIVQLTTPDALDYESEYMGHCVGKGSYDKGVQEGTIKIYSLRDADGEPHATFEVRGEEMQQCKGKGNKTPVNKYIPYVQDFVEKAGFEIKNDIKNVGLVKQGGKYYNVFDLPENFVCDGYLDLSEMDLNGVNFSGITVKGCLNLNRSKNIPYTLDLSKVNRLICCECDLSHVDLHLSGASVALSASSLPAKLDLSNCKTATLARCDFSRTDILLPQEEVDFMYSSNLPKKLDLSQMKDADLMGCYLGGVEFTLPKERISLSKATGLWEVLDLSGLDIADLSASNLSDIKTLIPPQKEINLSDCNNLPQKIDLSNCKMAAFRYCDLRGIDLKMPKVSVDLSGATGLPKILDFSKLEAVELRDCDLRSVNVLIPPQKDIDLSRSKLPKILDLSNCDEFRAFGCDLSDVETFKAPKQKFRIENCKNPPKELDLSNCESVMLEKVDLSKTVLTLSADYADKDLKETLRYAGAPKKVIFSRPDEVKAIGNNMPLPAVLSANGKLNGLGR